MNSSEAAALQLARTAFAVRACAAIAIHFFVPAGLFAPDELTYHGFGRAFAAYWSGESTFEPDLRGNSAGYPYLVGLLYVPAGEMPIFAKLLNAWIGSRAVLELFRLTRLIGGNEVAALRAARFMAYFPSMILWSSLLIRDVWVQWLLLRLAREMAELKGRLIPSRLVSISLLIAVLAQFRSYLLYAAIGPFVLSMIIGRSKDLIRNAVLASLLALGLTYVGSQSEGAAAKVQSFDLVELQRLRSWSSREDVAESGFANDIDVSTVGGALEMLPIGLAYFFLAPFPWQIGSIRQSLAIPETLYFYTLIPSIAAGILLLIRRRLADSMGVLLVTMTVTFGYAIGQGNVGTLYRHKAQVMGFYYAFAAVGMEARRRRTAPLPAPQYPVPPEQFRRGPAAAYSGR